jgi:N-acetylglucosamine kinase-like BadF-type ATPase
MGIDGGGSTLRVMIVDDDLCTLAMSTRGAVNPGAIGRAASAALIQDAIREALAASGERVDAVGIGIAGASAAYAADWLTHTVRAVLPGVPVAPSVDVEIALTGAHGARRGAIVLAGTGSAALAIDASGRRAQAGGWGWLLGDEGSGAWLALEGLRAAARWADGADPAAEHLARRMLEVLGLARPQDIIAWVYRQPPPIRELAAQAPLVLEAADAGDPAAGNIVARGVMALAGLARLALARAAEPELRFCGGLLTADNPLSRGLARALDLPGIPYPLHAPVVGAALLAKHLLGED